MNPLTLSFYPPYVTPSHEILPNHAQHQILHPETLSTNATKLTSYAQTDTSAKDSPDWNQIDKKFRRALPDEWYNKRASYRAIIMSVCPQLIKLDGVECERERVKLGKTMAKLAAKKSKVVTGESEFRMN